MEFFFETPRLILREIRFSDAEGLFKLDSNISVHKYLGGKTLSNIDEVIEKISNIQLQYQTNKIGRWAVIEKETNF